MSMQVPNELRNRAQWLLWRLEPHPEQGKKPRKMPYYAGGARRHGAQGTDDDRRQLVDFTAALAAMSQGKFDGVGFAFLPGDGLAGVDLDNVVDAETGEISARALGIVQALASYTEWSPSKKGLHVIVSTDQVGRFNSFKSNKIGVEVFCSAQFFTFTGDCYAGTPDEVTPISEANLRRLRATVRPKDRSAAAASARSSSPPAADDEQRRAEAALAYVDADDYQQWIDVGMALKHAFGEAGYGSWDRWSQKSAKYCGAEETRRRWGTFEPRGAIKIGTVFGLAKHGGWRPPARKAEREGAVPTSAPEGLPPKYSEERLAAEFTARNGEDYRYVAALGAWLFYEGPRWREEPTLRVFDAARAVVKERAAKAREDEELKPRDRERIATQIASGKTIASVVSIGRTDRQHAATVEQWDADPWVANAPEHAIDLRTGKFRPHRRGDYFTKVTGVSPRGNCPTWLAFLHKFSGCDDERANYLQRYVGYCLSGVTREHVLLYLWGTGRNGKSTFLNTVQGVLGDYAMVASMETFVESKFERHPTDLAAMRGARVVIAQEVGEDRKWDTSKIKQLTGGDKIRARFMRMDGFEYEPQFKLILAGNHKPSLRHVDEAFRRRLHLFPCDFTVPAAEVDRDLGEKLKAEWPGILAWAVQGCLAWQEKGLGPPASVRDATDEYLESEDALHAWLDEHVERDPQYFTPVAELRGSYQAWAERSGERFLGERKFSQAMVDHGFEKGREGESRVRGFYGVRIRVLQGRLNAVG